MYVIWSTSNNNIILMQKTKKHSITKEATHDYKLNIKIIITANNVL